ncbi:MAG: ABC transporter permease [Candidatus Nomurabacteria bacterium]|jgi:putative ABC transport system permease protein|nr:ABC transporter permease [Candidatus Nomurabacteria bacterium]
MTTLKLAFRSVRKSFRDFTVYFLTLTLGVSLFYVFNSIDSQQSIMSLTSGQSSALVMLNQIMSNFSILISVILGLLIIYANRYLLRRRKKEFGVYMTLGMERSQISRILVLETVFIGLIALVAGSALGVVLSQGMAVVTANLLGAGIASFKFIFSLAALRSTVLFFGLTFLLIMIFNVVMVRRQKLIDLIYAARRNERFKLPHLGRSVLLFILSLACIGSAYYLVADNGILMVPVLWSAVALGVVGTFLFFFSLSGFFLKLLQQTKKVYFSGLNMFVLRQINSKINTTYVSMTMVCLMLFVAICTLSSGMGLARAMSAATAKSTPYDASFSIDERYTLTSDNEIHIDKEYPAAGVDIMALAKERGVSLKFAKDYATVRYYTAEPNMVEVTKVSGRAVSLKNIYIQLSDYNRLLELQGIKPLALKTGEYAVSSVTPYGKELIDTMGDRLYEQTITLQDKRLSLNKSRVFFHTLETSSNEENVLAVVVPDGLLVGAPAARDVLNIQYKNPNVEPQAVANLNKFGDISQLSAGFETKAQVVEATGSITATLAYLAVYLGVVFLIAAATVLAIAQLSEASDNVRRYRLLHKVGTDDKMINRAVFAQILVYFGVPLTLALVHAVVGISIVSNLFSTFQGMKIMGSSLVAALIIIAIYGGYFMATYFGSKSVITREYAKRESET